MAAAFVKNLGVDEYVDAAQTTTVLSVSISVAQGNLIAVGVILYGAAGTNPSAVDNLGNTYTFREQSANVAESANTSILTAPVTTGGTLTSITVTHDSRQYRTIMAAEYSGVGAFSAAGGGSASDSSATGTWATNKTIPANGVAFGFVGSPTVEAMTAGSASGSPSTTVVLDTHYPSPGAASMSIGSFYAIAGGSTVTSFTGTSSQAANANAGAGAIFDPAAAGAAAEPDSTSLSSLSSLRGLR